MNYHSRTPPFLYWFFDHLFLQAGPSLSFYSNDCLLSFVSFFYCVTTSIRPHPRLVAISKIEVKWSWSCYHDKILPPILCSFTCSSKMRELQIVFRYFKVSFYVLNVSPLHRPIPPVVGGQNDPPPPGQWFIYHSTPEDWSKLFVKSRGVFDLTIFLLQWRCLRRHLVEFTQTGIMTTIEVDLYHPDFANIPVRRVFTDYWTLNVQ
jgi:hypothetical protein